MDETDIKIIILLIVNSRLSYREISEHLGLSVNAVYKRVQTLIDLEIIKKFTANINPYAANAIYTFIFGESKSTDIDKLPTLIAEHDSTSHIILSSRNYLYIGAMLKNIHQLDEYSSFITKTAEIETPIIGLLHGVHYSSPIPYSVPRSRSMNLDKLDLSIIRSLHDDSRKPISEVAEEVNSTANTVRRRLSRMMDEGLIELTIQFNPEKANDSFSLFQIKLKSTADKHLFGEKISEKYNPYLFFGWTFSNLPNMILCWIWTNNMKELNDLVANLKQEEEVDSIKYDIASKGIFFDTWKEKLLYQ